MRVIGKLAQYQMLAVGRWCDTEAVIPYFLEDNGLTAVTCADCVYFSLATLVDETHPQKVVLPAELGIWYLHWELAWVIIARCVKYDSVLT